MNVVNTDLDFFAVVKSNKLIRNIFVKNKNYAKFVFA